MKLNIASVSRTRIIGTSRYVFAAWEPTDRCPSKILHSTIRSNRLGWEGRIGTRSFTSEEYDRAYAAILRCYPGLDSDLLEGRVTMDMGQIAVDPYHPEIDGELDAR